MKTRLLFAATACYAVAFCFLSANLAAADELEQHPSLEHGNVTINAALDRNQLVIDFTSPAINVVGFDHEPRDDAERAATAAAAKLLSNGRSLFVMPHEARCQFEKADLQTPRWQPSQDAPAQGQPTSPSPHTNYQAHLNYQVRLTYQCWSPRNLTWLEPALLDNLRDVTEARLTISTPRGQQTTVAANARAHISLQ